MQVEPIYIRPEETNLTLASLASIVFITLGLTDSEERHSSNFTNGHYFAGYAKNCRVVIRHQDEWDFGFPFLLYFDHVSQRNKANVELEPNAKIMAQQLSQSGLCTFIPDGDDSRVDWDGAGILYEPRSSTGKQITMKV
jgi:hypothetical protein